MLEIFRALYFNKFDLFNAPIPFISDAVNGIGAFISVGGLDYFDSVTGTMREKRKGGGEDAISMADLRDIRIIMRALFMFIMQKP
jgi:hypothetical protein